MALIILNANLHMWFPPVISITRIISLYLSHWLWLTISIMYYRSIIFREFLTIIFGNCPSVRIGIFSSVVWVIIIITSIGMCFCTLPQKIYAGGFWTSKIPFVWIIKNSPRTWKNNISIITPKISIWGWRPIIDWIYWSNIILSL